eukprot:TRINITY_DN4818_c0_g1_i2.p1 TRINITY_DN4818_c0_g1~~TRINITY_DN4818_c0_g1_i2.p1  ORF type:complete len:1734 (+),score=360.62 TRINITY_DN4818_c0_g1_i2:61-5262(+)
MKQATPRHTQAAIAREKVAALLRSFVNALHACAEDCAAVAAIGATVADLVLADPKGLLDPDDKEELRALAKNLSRNARQPVHDAPAALDKGKLLLTLLGSLQRQGILNQVQHDSITAKLEQALGVAPTAGVTTAAAAVATEAAANQLPEDSVIDELRTLFATYLGKCKASHASLEDKERGYMYTCTITCKSEGSSFVDILLKFREEYPNTPPDIFLIDSEGLTSGDLMILETELNSLVQQKKGNPVCHAVTQLAHDYVAAAEKQSATIAVHEPSLPQMPVGADLTTFTCFSLNAPVEALSVQDIRVRVEKAAREMASRVTKEIMPELAPIHIVGVEHVLSPRLLKAFTEQWLQLLAKRTASSPSSSTKSGDTHPFYAPIVAFHGTWRSNVESIKESGLVAPWDLAGDNVVTVSTGSAFGVGIYVSQKFEVAHNYAACDSRGRFQVFVSLVAPGRAFHITNELLGDNSYSRCYAPASPDCDSHVAPDNWAVVLFQSSQCLPVLLLTYGSPGVPLLPVCALQTAALPTKAQEREHRRRAMIQWRALHRQTQAQKHKRTEHGTEQEKHDEESQMAKDTAHGMEHNLCFYRVPGSSHLWMLPLSMQLADTLHEGGAPPTAVHLIFILDKSQSMGYTFKKLLLPACGQLHSALDPDTCSGVFFGKTVDVHHPIASPQFFASPAAQATPLEPATNLLGGFSRAMELVFALAERCAEDELGRALEQATAHTVAEASEARAERRPLDPMRLQSPDNAAAARIAALQKRLKREQHVAHVNHVYVCVLMSDGADTENSAAEFDQALDNYYKFVTSSGLQTVFSVVGIGKDSDTKMGMRMKLATQTMHTSERTPCYYARQSAALPLVMQQLTSDVRRACTAENSLPLSLLSHEQEMNMGFVHSLTSIPQPDLNVVLRQEGFTAVLVSCTGLPPRNVLVYEIRDTQCEEFPQLDSLHMQAALLRLLATLVTDLKVAAVAGKNTDEALACVVSIVAGIKAQNLELRELAGISPSQRVAKMKTKRRLVGELEALVAGLREQLTLARSAMNSDQQAQWLNQASTMKFGAKALKRAGGAVTVTSMVDDLRRVCRNATLPATAGGHCSCLSKRTAAQHWREVMETLPQLKVPRHVTSLLYLFGMVGLQVRVARCEASAVDPWQIKVEYVSRDRCDTASAMCCLDALAEVKDSSGEVVTDVLVVVDPNDPAPYAAFTATQLYEAYTAVVFTRNPDVAVPAQKTALLMHSFVCCASRLLDTQARTPEYLEVALEILYSIRRRCGAAGESLGGSYWVALLAKLDKFQPGRYLTEAPEDDVSSVVKVLGSMCAFPEILAKMRLFSPEKRAQLGEVALALLAEAVSRGCRITLKGKQNQMVAKGECSAHSPTPLSDIALQVVSSALGIEEANCEHPTEEKVLQGFKPTHSYEYDRNLAYRRSVLFFKKHVAASNCPPRAVFACLALVNCLSRPEFADLDALIKNTKETALRGALMRELAAAHDLSAFIEWFVRRDGVPPCDPTGLITALYLQGMKCHNSKLRRDGLPSLADPQTVVRDIAASTRSALYGREVAALLASLRKERHLSLGAIHKAEQQVKQNAFLETHAGMPHLFTHAEVAESNQHRPKTDQLELADGATARGGLLKHHCCFPNCPLYLQNCATEKDRVLGSRHGIMRHLSLFVVPTRLLIPAFHRIGLVLLIRNPGITLEGFTKEMDAPTEAVRRSRNISVTRFEETCKSFWTAYAMNSGGKQLAR